MKKLFFSIIAIAIVSSIIIVGIYVNKSNKTPYEQLCEKGYTGTEEEFLNSLTEEDDALNDNEQEKTAYEIATQNGYIGTKEDWLEALTGDKSNADKYTNGNSVYDIAVDNGFTGSLEEWIEGLKEPLDKNSNNTKNDTTDTVNPSDSTKETTEQAEFTVIFKNYDGEELKTEVIKKGEEATPPATPQRKDYVFVGWDKTFNAVEANMVVNAMFKKITEPTIIVDRVDSSADEKMVKVNIAVKNNPGIASLNLNVAYAPELVLKNVKYNKDLKGQSMKPGQEESPITLTWVSPFEDMTGDWIFATLYFDVAENAKGDLPIYVTYDTENVYNMKEENIYFDIVNGAIATTN